MKGNKITISQPGPWVQAIAGRPLIHMIAVHKRLRSHFFPNCHSFSSYTIVVATSQTISLDAFYASAFTTNVLKRSHQLLRSGIESRFQEGFNVVARGRRDDYLHSYTYLMTPAYQGIDNQPFTHVHEESRFAKRKDECSM